jgi:hypothetical protein
VKPLVYTGQKTISQVYHHDRQGVHRKGSDLRDCPNLRGQILGKWQKRYSNELVRELVPGELVAVRIELWNLTTIGERSNPVAAPEG